MAEEPIKFGPIPGLAPKAGGIRSNHAARDTCGDCAYWQSVDIKNMKAGACFGNPPMMILTPRGPMAIRASTGMDDLACRHFKRNG